MLADGQARITAEVPLAEVGDYQTTLKSLTGGTGAFTLDFDHYATVPPTIQRQLQDAFKPAADD